MDEYLAFERASEDKHEFLDGDVYLMTGASRRHNLITANILTSLNTQLRQTPCEVYASDMRVRISSASYLYPDVVVVCDEPRFENDVNDTLLNPTLIVEVLSPSTEIYDRGKKFQYYRTLPSLREYVLVSQDTARIEHYMRQDNEQWLLSDITGFDAAIELPSIACTLALMTVYEKVSFADEQA